MSAPQPPSQPPQPGQPPVPPQSGPFAAAEPTIAIVPGGKPASDNADATQIVTPANDAPEATQVVRPGTNPPSGGLPQQPEATQVVRPSAPPVSGLPQQLPQPQMYGQPAAAPGAPQAPQQPYGQPAPGYPPQAPGFGQQLAQPPGYPPQQPGYPPQAPGGYGHPQGAPYQYGGPYQYASWGQRVVAGLVDYGILAVIAGIIAGVAIGSGAVGLIGIVSLLNLVNVFYNICYLGGVQGQTFGKKAAGIKLIREDSGQPVGYGLAFGRAILHIVDVLPIYIGFFAPLWDAKRQTFSDKIVNTLVVVAPKAAPGYPAPQQYGQPPRQW
jgi:uncharacterized RDD family membrane protein YckC